MSEKLPNVYLFNPTCEYAVANGKSSWQPNRLLQKMEEDLGTLPLFFARPNDVVLVKKLPSQDFLAHLKKTGLTPPRLLQLNEITKNQEFLNQPKNKLLPWGWSPAAHRLLEPLKPSCSKDFQISPVVHWKKEYREIYSKKFALEILKIIQPTLPAAKVLSPQLFPRVCYSKQDIEKCIEQWGKIMVKAPWSSSGRGLQKITKTPVVEKVWEKLLGIINDQGYVIAEPLLEKVLDLALQFEVKSEKVTYLGISRFLTDEKGRYLGNYLNDWPETLDSKTLNFTESVPEMIVDSVTKAVEKSLLTKYYEGNFGVDTLIFRDKTGKLCVNPCLEINVRQNMGLLSLSLEKLVTPGKKGLFQTFYQPGKSFAEFSTEMEKKYPLQFNNLKIESGFFPVTPCSEDTLFGAFILV